MPESGTGSFVDRLKKDFAHFGAPQYTAMALLGGAVVILGLWFMSWSTAPTWEVVASGLDTAAAEDALDELDAAGVDRRLANGGSAVEVPSAVAAEARIALGDLAGGAGGIEGYEILDRQGFMASSFRQRVDYQRAVEGELSRTILAMDGISTATVHLAIPEERLFDDDQDDTRASVVIGGNITDGVVASVANVVASSVPGLLAENVTVADTRGRILSGGSGGNGLMQDQQLEMQDLFEAQLEAAAESMLSVALGPGRAVVRVTADLDFDELESETLSYDTESQVTLREQTTEEAFTGDNTVPLGTLGTAEAVTDAGDLAGDSGSAYIRQDNNREFGVPSTRTVSRQAPGSVRRITVAVLLDETVDPAPDPAALEPLIAAAVGIDLERGDTIVVQGIAFDEVAEDAETEIDLGAAAAEGGGLDTIIGYVKTGAAVIGIILALLFLRKGLKSLTGGGSREPVEVDPLMIEKASAAAKASTDDDAEDGATAQLPAASASTASPAMVAGQFNADPDASSTVDMLDLLDSQGDEVAELLRGLMAEAGS